VIANDKASVQFLFRGGAGAAISGQIADARRGAAHCGQRGEAARTAAQGQAGRLLNSELGPSMPENKMDSRLSRLEALNKTLNPMHDLSGVFLPVGSPKQFDVMFLAEMPSMNVPKD
jgi:hypothetical protein